MGSIRYANCLFSEYIYMPEAQKRACDDITIRAQITCGYQPPWSVEDIEFSPGTRCDAVCILHFFLILFQIAVWQLDAGSLTVVPLH